MMNEPSMVGGRRVLVAEDEYFVAKELADCLEAAGAEVVGPVATTSAALSLVENERLDGAILDINLRDAPVYPVADALVQRGVPFVFATGYSATVIPERFASITLCEKPVAPDAGIRALFTPR